MGWNPCHSTLESGSKNDLIVRDNISARSVVPTQLLIHPQLPMLTELEHDCLIKAHFERGKFQGRDFKLIKLEFNQPTLIYWWLMSLFDYVVKTSLNSYVSLVM
jgi:hypothetical protein